MYSWHFIAPSLTRWCNEEPIFAQPLKYAFYVDTVMLSCPVFHGLVPVEQVYSLQSVYRDKQIEPLNVAYTNWNNVYR